MKAYRTNSRLEAYFLQRNKPIRLGQEYNYSYDIPLGEVCFY